jgi:hypothetical protein
MSKTAILFSVAMALAACSPAVALTHDHHGRAERRESVSESFQPPRMIQIRPGTWVGSYQCVYASGRSCDSI